MSATIRVLYLEDDPPDVTLVRETLRSGDLPAEVRGVDTRAAFEEALRAGPYEVILSDFLVPGFSGREALAVAQELCPRTPFIFVSGAIGEDEAIDLVKQGATDYVLKNRLARLVPALRRALAEAEEEARRRWEDRSLRESNERLARRLETNRRLVEKLRCQAVRDELTGLFNYRHLRERLRVELDLALRHHRPLSLGLLDTDGFKSINDSLGHPAGDAALVGIARVLVSALRNTDSVFRYGGDEFVLLLPDAGGERARDVAERVRRMIAASALVAGRRVTVSAGVSEYRPPEDSENLLVRADQALYAAKRRNGNCVFLG